MKRAVAAAYVAGVSNAEGAWEVGAALLGVACAVLVRAVLEPIVGLSHTSLTFFIFLLAAVLVAALVGFSPALLTLVFGALAAWFLNGHQQGMRAFSDVGRAIQFSERMQYQNWAVGWRLVDDSAAQ